MTDWSRDCRNVAVAATTAAVAVSINSTRKNSVDSGIDAGAYSGKNESFFGKLSDTGPAGTSTLNENRLGNVSDWGIVTSTGSGAIRRMTV